MIFLKLPFDQLSELCRNYYRGKSKASRDSREPLSKITKSAIGSVTKEEFGKILENFKTNLLSTHSSQIDTLKTNRRKEEKIEVL